MKNHLDALMQQTRDDDPDIRRHSAIELGSIHLGTSRQEAIELLRDLLEDQNIGVREAAEEALVKIGGRDAIQALIPCIEGGSTTSLNYAVEILGKIGTAGTDLIMSLLESKDHDVRKFGCDILGNMGYKESAFNLIELLNDPNINVAIAAGEALGKLRSPDAVKPLIRALHHPDTWMRCIAAESLGRIGDPRAVDAFIEMSSREDPIVRYTVIKAMGNLPDERVLPYIISELHANPMFASSAAQALEHLAALQGDDVYKKVSAAGVSGLFVRLLSSDNVDVLRSTINVVGKIQRKEAVQPLGRLLEHEKEEIVARAIAALVQIGATELKEIHAVFEDLFASPSPPSINEESSSPVSKVKAKAAICQVLGSIGSQESVGVLSRALGEEGDETIRVELTKALGKIAIAAQRSHANERAETGATKISAAYEHLIERLGDSFEAVRSVAAEALGKIGIKQAYIPLLHLLQDHSLDVRESASLALTSIQGLSLEEKVAPLRQLLQPSEQSSLTDDSRASIIQTIARIAGEQESDLIITFLNDHASTVRVAALEALQTFSPAVHQYRRLYDLMIPLLEDADAHVRIAAMQSLVTYEKQQHHQGAEEHDPKRAIELFMAMLSDPDPWVRYEACQQLGELVSVLNVGTSVKETVVDALLRVVQDQEIMVKMAAVEAFIVLYPHIPTVTHALPVLHDLLTQTTDREFKRILRRALSTLQEEQH